jgi:hypothetical protein
MQRVYTQALWPIETGVGEFEKNPDARFRGRPALANSFSIGVAEFFKSMS